MQMQEAFAKMDSLRELRGYQDQPKQMRAGAVGKRGILHMKFEKRPEKSILAHLYRGTPLLVQQALYWDESRPTLPICSIIDVGGGVLQGDRYYLNISVEDYAEAKVITQSATRIQAMDSNYATQYQEINVGKHAYLEYVPDSTILYRDSRYANENHLIVDETGILVFGETVMLGRKYHNNERYAFKLFSSLLEVSRPTGEVIFSEKLLVSQDELTKDFNAIMKNYDVFSTIVLLMPENLTTQLLEEYHFSYNKELDMYAGISLLPNNAGAIFRAVGKETYHLKAEIAKLISYIRTLVWPLSLIHI